MITLSPMKRSDHSLLWLGGFMLLSLVLIIVRLWHVQVLSFDKYERYREVQSHRTVRLPAPRGMIFDRQGEVLAENEPAFNIVMYLDQFREDFRTTYAGLKADRKLTTAQSLSLQKDARYQAVSNAVYRASLVVGQPSRLIRKRFEEHYARSRYVAMPVFEDLSREQMARFMEQGSRLKGFDMEVRASRRYPQGSLASHLLGYMRPRSRQASEEGPELKMTYDYEFPDFTGISGLERVYEAELRGEPGAKSILVNNLIYREEEEAWLPSLPGKNLILTLDSRIQRAAEEALRHYDPHVKGAMIVMDCQNGDILAMASAPTFDPNLFVGHLPSSVYEPMVDPKGPKPLFNRATHGQYQPGSTFKMLIGLAGLELGLIDPASSFQGDGYIMVGQRRIADTAGYGQFDFDRAFYKSSNAYFIHYGLKLGMNNIIRWGDQFFLGQETGLLPGQEASGFFPTPSLVAKGWHPGETANLSIGQDKVVVTPLQMAVMTSAIANGGKVFWPRLVAGWETLDPILGKQFESTPIGRLRAQLSATSGNLAILQHAMLQDVEHPAGSGAPCRIPGYLVAGKTGTAETERRLDGRKIKETWFVSYAPHDHPRYAVVVLVDDGISGGTSCAPLARKMYQTLKELPEPQPIVPRRQKWSFDPHERAL